jgi:Tfp pilus assembly protein PilZ
MFITTDRPTPTGSEVSLFFTLPDLSHPFSVLARVVWARGQETGPGSTTGMGVQFLDPKPSEAALIGAVVDRTCGDRPTA